MLHEVSMERPESPKIIALTLLRHGTYSLMPY